MTHNTTTTAPRVSVWSLTRVAMMTAILCLLGPMSIPIGPIPVSLSVLGVLLIPYVLPVKQSLAAVSLYILLGLFGLPVFSGYSGGPAKLFGPTGGYIIGYLPMVLIAGLLITRVAAKQWYWQISGMLLGLITCYALGSAWFMFLSKTTLSETLSLCVYPFIPIDLVKIAAACIVGNTIRQILARLPEADPRR